MSLIFCQNPKRNLTVYLTLFQQRIHSSIASFAGRLEATILEFRSTLHHIVIVKMRLLAAVYNYYVSYFSKHDIRAEEGDYYNYVHPYENVNLCYTSPLHHSL